MPEYLRAKEEAEPQLERTVHGNCYRLHLVLRVVTMVVFCGIFVGYYTVILVIACLL